ncbi:uncharacterized protein LOC115225976 [Octopus sinensis]|uniref:ATP-dependent DNA helicase n=1 Tax=Octopus sinensis TaxID=2607531 RepID=A0A6P7TSC0_9MOLL|nr:uncharacterized protein LOC115225976 [Octopus sinensis]
MRVSGTRHCKRPLNAGHQKQCAEYFVSSCYSVMCLTLFISGTHLKIVFPKIISDDFKPKIQRLDSTSITSSTTQPSFICNRDCKLWEELASSDFSRPSPRDISTALAAEYMREMSYNTQEMVVQVAQDEPTLLEVQRIEYNRFLTSGNSNEGRIFFLDAPGRTGKTFHMNLLLAKIRQKIRILIAVASSGIAATLLHGCRTAHSAFKLPLDLTKQGNPTCNVSRGSAMGNLLTECSLIIWDEEAMCYKAAFEALERSLQDLRRNMRVMGGVIVLLAGNFRQTLPVIPWRTRANEVNASIKSS